jgi:hypothetical protein
MSEEFKCTVPIGMKDGKYERCGEPAKYKVGNWYVCEGHKKYYTDANKWPAEEIDYGNEFSEMLKRSITMHNTLFGDE